MLFNIFIKKRSSINGGRGGEVLPKTFYNDKIVLKIPIENEPMLIVE